jgi:hypothetical protein
MIPAILVYWTRDKDGVGFWRVFKTGTRVFADSSRFSTKYEAVEYANELFRDESWVLLTVLNKDDSQDHCTSKFKDELLWEHLHQPKRAAS